MRTANELLQAVKAYCEHHGTKLGEYRITKDGENPIKLLGGTEDWNLIEAKITFNACGKPRTTFKFDGKITSIYQ